MSKYIVTYTQEKEHSCQKWKDCLFGKWKTNSLKNKNVR